MSKSDPISARKRELAEKERLLLSDMSEKGSKVKQIAIWSLVAGLVGLLGYGVYRSMSGPSEKKKKKKKQKDQHVALPAKINEEDKKVLDRTLEYGGPIIGRWILNQFKEKN